MVRQPAATIAVVGGGASGMSTAVHAARLGADVTVVERRHPGAGSTGASAGVFTTAYADELDVAMRVFGAAALSALERDRGLPFVRTGYLRLARTQADLGQLRRSLQEQRRQGVATAALLRTDELSEVVPHLALDGVAGGLWCPDDGYTDGHLLCSVWADELRELGGRVVIDDVVDHHDGARHELVLAGGDVVRADVVINAAGGWATKVGALLDRPVEVLPERHQLCFAHLLEPLDYTMPMVMDYVPGSGGLGIWFRQEGEDTLLAGLHSNDRGAAELVDPDALSVSNDDAFVEQVGALLLDRLLLADIALQPGWAGMYPHSGDHLPVVGPLGDPTVIACVGGGGVGVNLSPAMGVTAAEWAVLGRPRTISGWERLHPDRFAASAGRP